MLTFIPALVASVSLMTATPALQAAHLQPVPIAISANPIVVADRHDDNDRGDRANVGRGKHKSRVGRSRVESGAIVRHRTVEVVRNNDENNDFDQDNFGGCGPKQDIGRHLGHPGRHDMGRHLGCLKRLSTIRGCVVSRFDRFYTLQTREGLITVEPPTLQNILINEVINATGTFTGNGVLIPQTVTPGSVVTTCPFRTTSIPRTTAFQPGMSGNVVISGSIESMSGASFRLSTNRGLVMVDWSSATLIETANGIPVGSGGLRDGEFVTVVGTATNGVVFARQIRINNGLTAQNSILSGIVVSTNLAEGRMTVFSGLHPTTVLLTPQTVVERGNSTVDPFNLHAFETVTVYGNMSNGLLIANVVRINA